MRKYNAYPSTVSMEDGKVIIREYQEDGKAADAYKSMTPGEESKMEVKEAKFNSKKELADLKKMDKLLEQAYKSMNKLQHGKSLYMMRINDGIVEARNGIQTYQTDIERGELEK